jgi:hypothetical protein
MTTLRPPINNAVRALLQAAQERGEATKRAEMQREAEREQRLAERLRQLIDVDVKATTSATPPILDTTSAEATKPKRTRKRRITLGRAMRQASEAGLAVSGATLAADGSLSLTFGETPAAGSIDDHNEWDEVLSDGHH